MVEYVTCHENRVENFESGAHKSWFVFAAPPYIILVITVGNELHSILNTKAEVRIEKRSVRRRFITTPEEIIPSSPGF